MNFELGTLTFPRLYAIVDVEVCARAGRRADEVARAYLAGGARLLQLRAKSLAGGAFLELAARMVADAARRTPQLIVNDRADIARAGRRRTACTSARTT